MIRYLDSNALVKLFVEEPGSREVSQGVRSAHLVGTVGISRAEVVATFGKAFHRLRGYDSVQLAAAMAWQESLGAPVSLITFDVRLWEASGRAGLEPYPHDLPKLRESWKAALPGSPR